MINIDNFRADLLHSYPEDIVDSLLATFTEIRENYFLGKLEPAELNGGKFVEACVRLLQYQLSGTATPIGTPIRNMADTLRRFEDIPRAGNHDSYRLHIPRGLLSIYNIRNQRGVGHLPGEISPNMADANLIVSTANWIMAELYRLNFQVPIEEAQIIIDSIVERRLSLVHDLGAVRRVLDPKMEARDQTLLLLYVSHPDPLSDNKLLFDLEYKNASRYRRIVLPGLHQERLLNYFPDGKCVILPPGLDYVERNHNKWLEKFNNGRQK